jgi:PAS domain S-box-containing protein
MNHRMFRKKNSYRIIFEITATSIMLAFISYIILSIMIEAPPFQGIIRAIIIPIIIAPLMCHRLLHILIKLDLTEAALQQSEIRYKSIVDNSHDGMLIADDSYHLIYVNPELCKILGYSSDEIIGQDFRSFLDVKSKKLVSENYIRRQRGQDVPPQYEFDIVRKNGETRRVEIRSTVNKDSGSGTQTYAHVLDITDKRTIEEALKESEKKFKSITASAKDAIIMMNGNGKVSYWNEAAERMFGYSSSEILGKDLHRIIAPTDMYSDFYAAFSKFQATGHGSVIGKTIELTGLNKASMQFPVELSVSSLKQDGEWYSIGIVRDTSKRKKLEGELRQAYKMEAIGTLAAGIAHDFNNILSAIVGYTQLLQLSLSKDDRALNHTKEILKAGNRAKELVQQILTFSRQSEQELKPVSVATIVKEALKLLRASLPATIEIKPDLRSASLVMGDPTQIHQILMNLCTNASHAMQAKGGILKVDLQDMVLGSEVACQYPDLKSGAYLRLTVSDTGHGMSSSVVDQIFNPFFTTKEKGEGTGMGLSVVHGIVKNYGGTISVTSEPGKGSRFDLLIPAIESDSTSDENIEEAISGGTENILVVDDEPALVEIGAHLLKGLGYRVVTRTSSIEALNLLRAQSEKFDLVITDMTMPQMTGEKLAEELTDIRIDIPIILCTGFSHGITDEKAKQIGIKGILMKPIIRAELAKIVRKVLDASKPHSQAELAAS